MAVPKHVSSAAAVSRAAPAPEDGNRWVTLTSFANVGEAEVTRSVLEQAHIQARVADVHASSMLGIPAMALGGVGVQVMSQDLERARGLLRDSSGDAGRVVFRVTSHQTFSMALKVGGVAAGLGMLVATVGVMAAGLVPWLGLLGALAGALVGRQRPYFRCSNLGCGAVLTLDSVVCPACGREVAGTIASLDERLEAEDAVRAQRHQRLDPH